MEGSSLRVIGNCRLAKRDVVVGAPNVPSQETIQGGAQEMLNMTIEPTMCMKTIGSMTELLKICRAFWHEMQRFCENGRKSIGYFGRKRTGKAILEAKPGLKSAHRFIGPSINRLNAEPFFDGAMIRKPDAPIASPFHYVLANKRS